MTVLAGLILTSVTDDYFELRLCNILERERLQFILSRALIPTTYGP